MEDAGFHVKDVVTHIFGSGFPKSTAIDKAIGRAKYIDTDLLFRVTEWIRNRRDELRLTNKQLDEIAGVKGGACHWTASLPQGQPHIPTKERWEKLETVLGQAPDWMCALIRPSHDIGESESTSQVAQVWKGWGTALKPAAEHWILVQKPATEHNIAANVLKYGTGGINIDRSRIAVRGKIPSTSNLDFRDGGFLWDTSARSRSSVYNQHPEGRFPANIVVTRSNSPDCPARIMNDQSERETDVVQYFRNFKPEAPFFYCKKPSKEERGLDNTHPTVKPLRLMRYLTKMITPPNGIVLDPFMGSGTIGVAALFEKFDFIGIERDEIYHQIATKRLKGVRV